jgi:hypothetical protein
MGIPASQTPQCSQQARRHHLVLVKVCQGVLLGLLIFALTMQAHMKSSNSLLSLSLASIADLANSSLMAEPAIMFGFHIG